MQEKIRNEVSKNRIDKGKIVAEGKGQDVVDSGIFKKVFLGALE